jgi:hypothetical protein
MAASAITYNIGVPPHLFDSGWGAGYELRHGDLAPNCSGVHPGGLHIAGCRITPVLVFWTFRDLHWVKFTFETGFELSSSWINLPCCGLNLNRNILDFMRWPHIDLGAQDLNEIQRPKSFQNNSWK